MKKYEEPIIELLTFEANDIIYVSPDETDGWEGPGDFIDKPSGQI